MSGLSRIRPIRASARVGSGGSGSVSRARSQNVVTPLTAVASLSTQSPPRRTIPLRVSPFVPSIVAGGVVSVGAVWTSGSPNSRQPWPSQVSQTRFSACEPGEIRLISTSTVTVPLSAR